MSRRVRWLAAPLAACLLVTGAVGSIAVASGLLPTRPISQVRSGAAGAGDAASAGRAGGAGMTERAPVSLPGAPSTSRDTTSGPVVHTPDRPAPVLATVPGLPLPTVAVIDSGVRATHQEFAYKGASSTDDQFVAWWDFTSEVKPAIHLPAPGQTWDTEVADPYDRNGHGTHTASMAVGRNVDPSKDPSFAPGYPLAVAKVGKGDGTIEGDIGAAVRWAVDTAGASVISISIGSIAPFPEVLDNVHEAARYARQHGVLVVVANGNGFNDMGIPGDPGWASPSGDSTEVLSVGADGLDAYQSNTDPEVVGKFFDVMMADFSGDTKYSRASGTSFSTPLVAGMAARLILESRLGGREPSPDYIEQLLKYSARDTDTPPAFEGYGVLDAASFAGAVPHAGAGTLPARPAPDPSGTYVETVGGTLRDAWSNKLDGGLQQLALSDFLNPGPSNGLGSIGPSTPAGGEYERYVLDTTRGQWVSFNLTYAPTGQQNDLDLHVFLGGDPLPGTHVLDGTQRMGSSANGSGVTESVSFRSPGGPLTVVVLGWSVTADQPYALSTSGSRTAVLEGEWTGTFGAGLG
jgi:hypothetical protein